ncbi:hypothetical protein D5S17_01790 [Pseudonocardiaceae bacterium YIM PH 21723]|nr:hypothetical protein D5S17_01790 [Pseudonocardiaceae bacterium YIM PH 21723]
MYFGRVDEWRWQLLRELDDPLWLAYPAEHDQYATDERFHVLRHRLGAEDWKWADGGGADRDTGWPHASYVGRITVPGAVLTVSNFAPLVGVSGDPGPEVEELDELGWVLIPEEPLWRSYDGSNRTLFQLGLRNPTWWTRFFDNLY